MSFLNFMSNIWFKQSEPAPSSEVTIQDGRMVGAKYHDFGNIKEVLSDYELSAAYEKISCIGTSVDLISNNMQMIEPVFWDPYTRETQEFSKDKNLLGLRDRFEKPNSIDNRKTFISKSVKNYILYGVCYYVFLFDSSNQITSIKIIDHNCVSIFADTINGRVERYTINNSGNYNGEYVFDGRYYTSNTNTKLVLAPFINNCPQYQYLPASILRGCGLESLMYWTGCYHNKSLLNNEARPSLAVIIKNALMPQKKEKLREEIRINHSGSGNSGKVMIMDGASDMDIKQLSQNNKDMEFTAVLEAAESAVYKRLGTNWVLGKNIQSKDLQKGMELLYDMTICPMFQSIFNHIFDVYKSFNSKYRGMTIFYLEQDIPALRPRFLTMMKDMPNLGIFIVKERRKMFNYPPLGDERDNELVVQSVMVTQTGNNGTNETKFTGN